MMSTKHKRFAGILALLSGAALATGACGSDADESSRPVDAVEVSMLEPGAAVDSIGVWSRSVATDPSRSSGTVKGENGTDDNLKLSVGAGDGGTKSHYPGEIFWILAYCDETDGGGWPTVGECVHQHQTP